MIYDGHAYAFPDLRSDLGFDDSEEMRPPPPACDSKSLPTRLEEAGSGQLRQQRPDRPLKAQGSRGSQGGKLSADVVWTASNGGSTARTTSSSICRRWLRIYPSLQMT